ncbi:MAG TPA: trypsin-like peptidase domain-containing protein [Coriobacteriia bacterium]|nr:trypsin-like peptidase domain-containing protein [Coriobacteriia bacterium]
MADRKALATRVFGVALALLLTAGAATGCTAALKSQSAQAPKSSTSQSTNGATGPEAPLSGELPDVATASGKISPSVVFVEAASTQQNSMTGASGTATSSGSGIIIKSDGYILTNNHVVEDSSKITVTIDGAKYTAKVVGTDAATDLAVLKIAKTGLPAATIGAPKSLKVGQWVIAVGFPYGLDKTVTFGIVSGLGRATIQSSSSELTAYTNLIQTDASINPGNSGGALADLNGQVLGVNTLIESKTGENTGIGFAIPIDFAMNVADQIMKTGSAQHAYLGVGVGDTKLNYDSGQRTTTGAAISIVESGSPAEKAGLRNSDIITKIGDQVIETSSDVFTAVRSHKPGDKITIEFTRKGEKMSADATLVGKTSKQVQQTQQQSPGGYNNGLPNGSSGQLPPGHP